MKIEEGGQINNSKSIDKSILNLAQNLRMSKKIKPMFTKTPTLSFRGGLENLNNNLRYS